MSKYKIPDNGYDKDPIKQEVVLACGTGSGVALPGFTGAPVLVGTTQPSFVVGTVTLDTTCLEKPTVKVDFSSVVNFLGEVNLGGISISILFTLSKVCEGDRIPLATWTYQKTVGLGLRGGAAPDGVEVQQANGGVQVDFRESFGFTWCECQDCPGCCTYIVEVADFQNFNIQSASITNVSISALAVSC